MNGAIPDDIARDEQTRLGIQLRLAQENLAHAADNHPPAH
jgi:hypothetical protein